LKALSWELADTPLSIERSGFESGSRRWGSGQRSRCQRFGNPRRFGL